MKHSLGPLRALALCAVVLLTGCDSLGGCESRSNTEAVVNLLKHNLRQDAMFQAMGYSGFDAHLRLRSQREPSAVSDLMLRGMEDEQPAGKLFKRTDIRLVDIKTVEQDGKKVCSCKVRVAPTDGRTDPEAKAEFAVNYTYTDEEVRLQEPHEVHSFIRFMTLMLMMDRRADAAEAAASSPQAASAPAADAAASTTDTAGAASAAGSASAP
ncbi:hypothetical protein [Eleftheria terrae]|uniref:hypothetical protein n=1 Tax=Eleftheria terrae TaxID=1597781 RepID=UPI00263B69A8|nr:hypothetical protein [Eleftheria terrae]WKB52788.1 hypothetical protein N7L95_23925 [Eleftheria terrae]